MSDFTTCETPQTECPYTGSVADCAVADCVICDTGVAGDCSTEPPTNWNCEG